MHRNAIFIIFFLVGATYFNALFNGFVGDDGALISDNTFYRSWVNFPRLFHKGYNFEWQRDLLGNSGDRGSGSVSYRPVDNTTYFVDYWIWKLNPFGFHLHNVLLHIGNAILVYFLLIQLNLALAVSLFAALVFGVHPIQSEAICAIGYRADSLACFFVLLAMHAWILFVKSGKKRFGMYWFSLGAYFLAVFSKESAIMFPAMALLYEVFFVNKGKEKPGPVGRVYAGLAAVAVFYLYVYWFVFPNSVATRSFILIGGSWPTHAIGMLKIWGIYVASFLCPTAVHPLPGLYAPQVITLWDFQIFLSLVSFIVTTAFIWIFFERRREVSFLLAWFLIFYMPVSDIIPIPNSMAHRFMYLPSVGFLTALAVILNGAYSAPFLRHVSKRLEAFLRGATLGLCVLLTMLLNAFWSNGYMLASEAVKYYPDSSRANTILGILNYSKGYDEKAANYFLQSLRYGGRELDGGRIDCFLGMCYLAKGQLDRSARHFNIALKIFPDDPGALYGLGNVLYKKGNVTYALKCLNKARDLSPRSGAVYISLLDIYVASNQVQEARQLLDKARVALPAQERKGLQAYFEKIQSDKIRPKRGYMVK